MTDLSKVNLCMDDFSYPQTSNSGVLNCLKSKKILVTCDLAQCYHQLKVRKATSDELLTFIGPSENATPVCYQVVPMGGKNSSQVLAMALNIVYSPVFEKMSCDYLIYADNILIFGDTVEATLQAL